MLTVGLLTRAEYASVPASPQWVLVGGLSSTGASFRLRYDSTTSANVVLTVEQASDGQTVFSHQSTDSTGLEQVTVDGLIPQTEYIYTLSGDSESESATRGTFTTPASEGTQFDFSIVAASCSWTGSTSSIYTEAASAPTTSGNKPLLVLHGGDFHYEDISSTSLSQRITAIDTVLHSSSQQTLFNSMAMAYMWDDHDWLGNDSDGYNHGLQARSVALQSYHEAFPYYQPLPASVNVTSNEEEEYVSPYYAFTIGTVRFILTDLMSESTAERMFSEEQRDWFFGELANATAYDYVVWLSTKPWIGEEDPGDDSWMGHYEERAQISDWIQYYIGNVNNGGKQNLIVVSGDAHMVAFDDGSHTYYGNNTAQNIKSFPILQTGPWDRMGSVKGGPYSHGCTTVLHQRNHQYSVIDFIFEDQQSCIQINSYSDGYRAIFAKKICGSLFHPIASYASEEDTAANKTCDAPPSFTTNTYIALGVSLGLILVVIALLFCYFPCGEAFWLLGIVIFFYVLSAVLGWAITTLMGVKQFDTFVISLILAIQMGIATVFVVFCCMSKTTRKK